MIVCLFYKKTVFYIITVFFIYYTICFRIPVHTSNSHGPIMHLRVGKPSVEMKFGINFTHDRSSIGMNMYDRSMTFEGVTEPHFDSSGNPTFVGTELFQTGPTQTRMSLEYSPDAYSSEYDGVIGLGRRSNLWQLHTKATFTSSVIVMDGIHEAFSTLGYVNGAPIDCLQSLDEFSESESICVAYGRVMNKLYRIEIFGGNYHGPISLPSSLYNELFFKTEDNAELPTIEIEFNQSPSIQQRKKKEEKRVSINRCVSEYKALGIQIAKNSCKNPYHYVMEIDPSDYIFESDEQARRRIEDILSSMSKKNQIKRCQKQRRKRKDTQLLLSSYHTVVMVMIHLKQYHSVVVYCIRLYFISILSITNW